VFEVTEHPVVTSGVVNVGGRRMPSAVVNTYQSVRTAKGRKAVRTTTQSANPTHRGVQVKQEHKELEHQLWCEV